MAATAAGREMTRSAIVVGKVEGMWDDPEQRRWVLASLDGYGMDQDEPEVERVQLAILKLSTPHHNYTNV